MLPNASPSWRTKVFSLDEARHPKVKALATSAERFIKACLRDNRENGTWFTAAGGTGTGKTHTARRVRAIFDSLRLDHTQDLARFHHMGSAEWLDWPEIAEMGEESFKDVLVIVRNSILVIIDDLGADVDRFKTGSPTSRLCRILETAEKKWLFVTTNVEPGLWKVRFDQRAADRLLGGKYISLFEVPSYRTQRSNP